MATPRLVLLIFFAVLLQRHFPVLPPAPPRSRRCKAPGLKASACFAIIFAGKHPQGGGCLQPEEQPHHQQPLSPAHNRIWERMSGHICLPFHVQEHAVSAESTFSKGINASPRVAAELYLERCKKRRELSCRQALLPSQPDSPEQPGCFSPP